MRFIPILFTLLLPIYSPVQEPVPAGTHHYFFLSDRRIVTVELINTQKAILNYINLGDTFEIIQAPMLAILDSQQSHYRGHVFEVENPANSAQKFKVTDLLKPHQFRGYSVLGNYRLKRSPERAYFRVGGLILKLESISREDFELMAARIEEMDMTDTDSQRIVLEAGFNRGYGVVFQAGTKKARKLEKYFPDLNSLPPLLLANPSPRLPSSALNLPDLPVVKLSAFISRDGRVFKLGVIKGINPELDALAMDTVRNSWKFLPAISKNDIAVVEMVLNVVFQR